MNHSPFWPLVWKEYRAGRAFWLAMAGMGLVAQAGVAWLAHRPTDRDWWLYGIALMISAGFAVGIGGTLFAVEHEERTFGLMRILPLKAKELGAAKILCALLGLAGLLAVLWLAAGALAGWHALPPRDSGRLWGLWGLACLEGLAWGVLCSLVFSSPLRATVMALLAVTISIQAAATLTSGHNLTEIASYTEAIPYRLVLLAIVGGLDAWLLPRWLAGRVPHVTTPRSTVKSARRSTFDAAWRSPVPRWLVSLGHLMWQAWREVVGSAWLLGGGVVVSLLVTLFVLAVLGGVLHVGDQWAGSPTVRGLRLFPWFALLPFVLVTCLCGSLVFRVDPISGTRFLAERGVAARLVWLARQVAWGGWIFALFLASSCLSIVTAIFDAPSGRFAQDYETWIEMTRDEYRRRGILDFTSREAALNALLTCTVLLSAFAVAQLVSLVVRRRLLAAVLSIFLGVIAAGWAYLMFAIDIPWWWSVLPLAAGCLLASWLRTPAWLLARTGWRGWILPAAAVVAPLVFFAIAVPRYRADEIPALPSVEVSRYPTVEFEVIQLDWSAVDDSPAAIADVKAALALYQRAYDAHLASRHEPSDADRQAAVELVLEASRYRSTWLSGDPRASWRLAMPIYNLGSWLPDWADAFQKRGQLDKALEVYVAGLRLANHFDECAGFSQFGDYQISMRSRVLEGLRSWAGAPGQTPEQLREAIRRIDETHVPLSAEARLRSWYYATIFSITDFPANLTNEKKPPDFTSECWITSQLPLERGRALHLASFIASAELEVTRLIEGQLAAQDRFEPAAAESTAKPARRGPWPIRHWLTPLFQTGPSDWVQFHTTDNRFREANQWLRTTPLFTEQGLRFVPSTWSLIAEETDLRATKLILALEAWKAEHGQLPAALDRLVPDELAVLPLDPIFGEPFLYYPRGLAKPPDDRILLSSSPELSEALEVQPDYRPPRVIDWSAIGRQPFLWSALGPVPGVQPVVVNSRYYGPNATATYYDLQRDLHRWWHLPVPDDSVLQAGQAYVIGSTEDQQQKEPDSDTK